jgi:fatty acyl-CoA reductase
MENLQSLVHVSTAYSNPNRKNVGEQVYPCSSKLNAQSFMQVFDLLPADVVDLLADKIQGNHPNTYTLTKHIAEQVVLEYSSILPLCIVRPSIVTGAIEEPYPGWVDNVSRKFYIVVS